MKGVVIPDADKSATITIKDDDQPVLTIAAGSPVTEAGPASFTITSTKMPPSGLLTVNYTPVSANFLESGSGTPVDTDSPIRFQTSGAVYTATLPVTLHDDGTPEKNEYLMVTLNDRTGYTVGETATASVHISDNDAPIPSLTIAGPDAPVFEGF